jgi:hypothetical protein
MLVLMTVHLPMVAIKAEKECLEVISRCCFSLTLVSSIGWSLALQILR